MYSFHLPIEPNYFLDLRNLLGRPWGGGSWPLPVHGAGVATVAGGRRRLPMFTIVEATENSLFLWCHAPSSVWPQTYLWGHFPMYLTPARNIHCGINTYCIETCMISRVMRVTGRIGHGTQSKVKLREIRNLMANGARYIQYLFLFTIILFVSSAIEK